MYPTRYIWFFILILLFAACSQKQDKALPEIITDPQGHLTKGIAISGGSDSEYGDLAGQTINQDSLTIITPGENGIPLPEKIPAGKPKVVPTNTNIHPAGEPKTVLAGKPDIIRIVKTHSRASQPDDSTDERPFVPTN
ncbi:MAG: hypothetical protein HY738_19265, partial [Bacteroidia bacterium]|nr:hypothetical protein [Bacteroidia bacterium]